VRNKSGQAERHEKCDRQLKHWEIPMYQPLAKRPIGDQRFSVASSRGQNGFVAASGRRGVLIGRSDRTSVAQRLPPLAEVRADVGAALTAGSADEPRFEIGQPDVFRPPIGAYLGITRGITSHGGGLR
jgi:hypothetical protein